MRNKEIWRPIPGFEGLYEASNIGRVKSLKRGVFAMPPHKSGYYYVCIRKNGITKSMSVHRLIAKTFHPNDDHSLQVNHKDGNKLNNRADNLEWVTKAANIQHTFTHLGRRSSCLGRFGAAHPLSKKIRCITTGDVFDSISDASRKYKIHEGNIGEVCMGKRKTAGKMKFKYL